VSNECRSCRWWVAFIKNDKRTGRGDCHRYPPMPSTEVWTERSEYGSGEQLCSETNDYWPTTDADEFCGEYAAAEVVTVAGEAAR